MATQTTGSRLNPRVGMLATIRNRLGIVVSIEPYDTTYEGRLHLIGVEYTDADATPEDLVLWEREHVTLLEPTLLRPGLCPTLRYAFQTQCAEGPS